MNTKEYISSGIIESYVLGVATDSERLEFESACSQYPEIENARKQFELALEEQLQRDGIQPPSNLKAKIEEKINSWNINEQGTENEEVQRVPVRSINKWRWVAAALIIVLLGLGFYVYTLSGKNKQLQEANNNLNRQLQQNTEELTDMKKDVEMLHKPYVKMAAMRSSSNPSMYATIYWDTTSKDVYLMVNNMPQPASDKQYQLWALLNGKPIDLGVLARQDRLLVKMKNVENAQAFAITLEPMGGSTSPTSSPLVLSKL